MKKIKNVFKSALFEMCKFICFLITKCSRLGKIEDDRVFYKKHPDLFKRFFLAFKSSLLFPFYYLVESFEEEGMLRSDHKLIAGGMEHPNYTPEKLYALRTKQKKDFKRNLWIHLVFIGIFFLIISFLLIKTNLQN